MKFLVTGAAGFIGFHTIKRLLEAGHAVVGIDNLNDYYDVNLKQTRVNLLQSPLFSFRKIDIAHQHPMSQLFAEEKFDRVNPSCRSGGRTLFTGKPTCLRRS